MYNNITSEYFNMVTLNSTIALRQLRGNNSIEAELQAMKVCLTKEEFILQSCDCHVTHII